MDAGFGEAMIALLPNLRRYALSLTRRGDQADDLVQQTVERAIANAASFDRAQRLEPGCSASCATLHRPDPPPAPGRHEDRHP